jgi:hypothetical protein
MRIVRCLGGAAVGAATGLAQYAIDRAGMRRAAAAEGLSGIGVAAGWALVFLVVTLVLLLPACRALALRYWASAAGLLLVGELAVVALLWDRASVLGLHGDGRAVLFVVVATILVAASAGFWPQRVRQG